METTYNRLKLNGQLRSEAPNDARLGYLVHMIKKNLSDKVVCGKIGRYYPTISSKTRRIKINSLLAEERKELAKEKNLKKHMEDADLKLIASRASVSLRTAGSSQPSEMLEDITA